MQQYWTIRAVVQLSIKVKEAKRQDYERLCISQARELEEAALEGCSSRLFALLRRLKKFVPRRHLRLRDADGFPAAYEAVCQPNVGNPPKSLKSQHPSHLAETKSESQVELGPAVAPQVERASQNLPFSTPP